MANVTIVDASVRTHPLGFTEPIVTYVTVTAPLQDLPQLLENNETYVESRIALRIDDNRIGR